MKTETGYTVCRRNKPIAIVHSHPSGNPSLSERDKTAARHYKLIVCTQISGAEGKVKTRCYKPQRRVDLTRT